MKLHFFLLMLSLLLYQFASTQGCIMIRNISGFGQYNLKDNAFSTSDWQLNINNRYFKAWRDFKGTEDQKTPPQNESIIKSYVMDVSLSKFLRNGWSLNVSLPILSNSRETSLEHGGANTQRHTTRSFGLGDIRFTAYKWLLQPTVNQRVNIQLGLGLKLPTGDYKYQDYFYRNDTTKILSTVNPSIQLGDGGTGIVTEMNLFYSLNTARTVSLYGNFYYLMNPRDQNGATFTTGRTPTHLDSITNSFIVSVPDQYSLRAGLNVNVKDWAFSIGLRDEGTPVYDFLGASEGLRKPGYNVSVEPGIVYRLKKISWYAYVPYLIRREIKQNVPEKLKSQYTGSYTASTGGSGNYYIFLGVQFKL